MNGARRTAAVPAAMPIATAGVVSRPGRTSALIIAQGDTDRDRGKHRAAAEAGAERERVGEPLRHHEEQQHRGGALGDDVRHLRLPREEHEVDGPIGSGAETDRKHTDESAGDDERELRPRLCTSSHLVREMPYADDHPGDHHGDDEAPGEVGHPHAVVGGQRRSATGLAGAAPASPRRP